LQRETASAVHAEQVTATVTEDEISVTSPDNNNNHTESSESDEHVPPSTIQHTTPGVANYSSFGSHTLRGHIGMKYALIKQNISALSDSFLFLFIQLQQVSFN
jgi:hypothetical protein